MSNDEAVNETATAAKSKTEYETITMSDKREVQFAGKRKVLKETLIDASRISVDATGAMFAEGAVGIRMDFRNGDTRTIMLPLSLLAEFAAHGASQKFGDELATSATDPMTEEDMVIAIDDLNSVIQSGNWGRSRASSGGSVAGAGIVVAALAEATGKGVDVIKAYMQKKLDETPGLTRRALYDSFRVAGTRTGEIIARMENAKRAKAAVLDADAELSSIS